MTTTGNSEGVFITGSATGPKTLPESINEAKATVLAIHTYLSKNDDMIDFGYSLTPSSRIDLDKIDKLKFKRALRDRTRYV